MDFQKLVGKVGPITAAKMRFEAGKVEEIELDKSGWKQVASGTSEDDDLQKVATLFIELFERFDELQRAKLLLRTEALSDGLEAEAVPEFNRLITDYCHAFDTGDIERNEKLLKEIESLEGATFSQWRGLLDNPVNGSLELRGLAIRKIEGLADSFEHWAFLFETSLIGTGLEEDSFEEACKLAKSFEHWQQLYDSTSARSDRERIVLEGMIRTAETFEHWLEVHLDALENLDMQKHALEQMIKLEPESDESDDE